MTFWQIIWPWIEPLGWVGIYTHIVAAIIAVALFAMGVFTVIFVISLWILDHMAQLLGFGHIHSFGGYDWYCKDCRRAAGVEDGV